MKHPSSRAQGALRQMTGDLKTTYGSVNIVHTIQSQGTDWGAGQILIALEVVVVLSLISTGLGLVSLGECAYGLRMKLKYHEVFM